MMIRERLVEAHKGKHDWSEYFHLLHELWEGGQLLPTDEVDARIEAAVAAERERCARIVEKMVFKNRSEIIASWRQRLATAIREQNHDE